MKIFRLMFCLVISLSVIGCMKPDIGCRRPYIKYIERERLSPLYPELSISNSDSTIYLTAYKNGFTQSYSKKANDSVFSKLLAFDSTYVTNVHAAQKSPLILFDKNMKDTNCICILNLETGSIQKVYCSEHTAIMECVFSKDESKVIFTISKYFGNYSPIARPGYHNYDIYSVNIDGTGFKQITNKSYYSINSLNANNNKNRAYYVAPDESDTENIVFTFIFSCDIETGDITRVFPSNSTKDIGCIYNIAADNNDSLIFITNSIDNPHTGARCYEIFALELNSLKTFQLTKHGGNCEGLRISNSEKAIYYLLDKEYPKGPIIYELHKMSFDGKENIIIPLGSLSGTNLIKSKY
jgi:hypothetical protein